MKLFIILTFITLALSDSFFLRSPFLQDYLTGPIDINHYFTSLFHSFELKQPHQLLKCFNQKTADIYFKHIIELTNLVTDAESRNFVAAHVDWWKLEALCKELEPTWNCISKTQDWSNLLSALDIKERIPELFNIAHFIYLQANYGKLSFELPPVVTAIKNDDYRKAGALKANIIRRTVSEIKERGLALLAVKGYWNGVHMGLDLPDAKSVYQCSNNDIATVRLEFVYGLASAVASGCAKDAADNVKKWYEETGEKLLKKLPESYWKCWKTADDTKTESEKIGVDVTTPDYMNRVSKFVRTQPETFWGMQKIIKETLDQNNFIHAGVMHGRLMEAAAKCK